MRCSIKDYKVICYDDDDDDEPVSQLVIRMRSIYPRSGLIGNQQVEH